MKDSDEIVRATAASSLIFLQKNEAVLALSPLLDDKAAFVRREAAYALGKVGGIDASAPLMRLLQKENILEVRTAAVSALGSIGDPNAVSFLVAILKQKPKDDEEFLRRSAARSIGQIAQVIQTGKEYLVTPQHFLPNKYKETTSHKVEKLTAQYPIFGQAIAELARVLLDKKESDDTLREAAYSLGTIGDNSAAAVIESNLNNP
ncbi:MAG: HEAT repeat domain-containing protein, partial [Blastocatellia bacterium]